MVSVSWDKFKALYAVETLQGYTETEIGLLKKIFGTLPCVLRIKCPMRKSNWLCVGLENLCR